MSLLAVGLSHRSASTRLLERVAVGADDLPKLLHELREAEHLAEALVLSTCNRLEVYVNATTFHGGVTEVSDLLARVSGVPLEDLTDALYVHHDARAVQHLFSVACGLDSMLVGEAQVVGQLRSAFSLAQSEGTVGRMLGELVRHALRVGKRARSETGIDRAGASLVGVGLQLAAEAVGPLDGRPALVVGAGATGSLAVASLQRANAGTITIANRTGARASRLAGDVRGRSVALDQLPAALRGADVVVTATGATGLVLTRDVVEAALPARDGRPLFLLDLALPHDVDPAVRSLPGVTLVDLDALRGVLETAEAGEEVEAARRLVVEEVAVFSGWQRAMRVAPTVVALRSKADQLVAAELDRLAGRVDLDPRTRAEVETAVRRVVDKLLHAPTVRVKELAEAPGGDAYAEALRELFGLDRKAAEVVSAPDLPDHP